MGFVASHILVTGLEAKRVSFSMKSIDTFTSHSNSFMTIHCVFPIIASCTFLFCYGGWIISAAYFEHFIHNTVSYQI